MNLLDKTRDFLENSLITILTTGTILLSNLGGYYLTSYELKDKPKSEAVEIVKEYNNYLFAQILTTGSYMAAIEKLEK